MLASCGSSATAAGVIGTCSQTAVIWPDAFALASSDSGTSRTANL
jgi:hypothetical protein